MKTYLQNWSENRQFSKGRPFTSRGLLMQKSVFLTGHVLRDVSMFLQNWLIRWFEPIADAFTVPPKNRVTGASTQWRNWSKIRRRRRPDLPTHVFKRRPHKMPFGQWVWHKSIFCKSPVELVCVSFLYFDTQNGTSDVPLHKNITYYSGILWTNFLAVHYIL